MANFLDNFFNKFSKNKNQSVVGIDIGSSSIKVVQIKKQKGKIILETYGEVALGPYANTQAGRGTNLITDKIAEALNDVRREANITSVDSAISIPMRSSMVSMINLPIIEEKELSKMVPIEARKYIPVPLSEVSLDWFVIPRPEVEKSKTEVVSTEEPTMSDILVIAIHNDVLSDLSKIVSLAKLNTTFFEVEMFSTIRSVIETDETSGSVLVFDVGASSTKIYIVERGIIKESHTINKGSQDITLNIANTLNITVEHAEKLKRNFGKNPVEQDKKIEEIIDFTFTPVFGQANMAIVNYGQHFKKIVSKIILVGGGSLLKGMKEKVQEKMGVPVVLANPFTRTQSPAFLEETLAQIGSTFSVAIGLALRKLQEIE